MLFGTVAQSTLHLRSFRISIDAHLFSSCVLSSFNPVNVGLPPTCLRQAMFQYLTDCTNMPNCPDKCYQWSPVMLITLCGILEFFSYGGVIGSRPEVLLISAIIYSVMTTDFLQQSHFVIYWRNSQFSAKVFLKPFQVVIGKIESH